jgi:hypothetical protein
LLAVHNGDRDCGMVAEGIALLCTIAIFDAA